MASNRNNNSSGRGGAGSPAAEAQGPGTLRRVWRGYIYRRTLAWVNNKRREMGAPELDELLTGVRAHGGKCGVANSLGAGHAITAIEWVPAGKSWQDGHELPWYVMAFVKHFDLGHYPEHVVTIEEWREMASLEAGEAREPTREGDPFVPASGSQERAKFEKEFKRALA